MTTQSAPFFRPPLVTLPFLLLAITSLAAPPTTDDRSNRCRIDGIQMARIGSTSVELQVSTPANHYLRIDRAPDPTSPWQPVQLQDRIGARQLVRLPPTSRTVPSSLFFRVVAIPDDFPDDTDHDGLDDRYELRRSHVLDALDPNDAWLDADGDGLDNLTEYLFGTEVAPPNPAISQIFDSLAALAAARLAPLPSLIRIRGHDQPGDGWGGWFAYLPRDTRVADGAVIVEPGPGIQGRLERQMEASDPVLAAWWRPPANGVDDARPALRSALAFASRRTAPRIVLPPGRFLLANQISYADPTRASLLIAGLRDFEIDGTGATLVSHQDGEFMMLQDCRRGSIHDLSFEGSGSDRAGTSANYAVIQLTGDNSDLDFSRCRLQGFMHGISHLHGPKTSVRVNIRDCSFVDGSDTRHAFLGIDGAAISGIGDDWTIENNAIHECARGIEIENTASTHPISRVRIAGNRLTNVRNLGIMAFLGRVDDPSTQQADMIIRDNLLVGKPDRHRYADGTPIPIILVSLNGGTHWSVSGNICRDADFAAISLYSNQGPLTDSVVSDNIIADITFRGIQIVTDPVWPTSGVVVVNNHLARCGDRALLLAADNVSAQGNLIEDCGGAGIAVGDSWLPDVPVRDVSVRRNVIRRMGGGAPGILVLGNAYGVTVDGNDISDAEVGIRSFLPEPLLELGRNVFLRVTTETDLLDP